MSNLDIYDAKSFKQAQALHATIEEQFFGVEDYRRKGSIIHKLSHILFITICAVTSGCNSLKSVAIYAQVKQDWLKSVLGFKGTVPSYLTFWTVFAMLLPEGLSLCFTRWVQTMVKASKGRLIAIDGKAQRGSRGSNTPNSFVHIVSAWSSHNGLTLAQCKVDDKSNEIKAIPQILDLIDIEGCIITIDAMGTQKKIASKIIENKGNYILALKGNHSKLHDEISNYFDQAIEYGEEGNEYHKHEEEEMGHGRIEKRHVFCTENIDFLEKSSQWKGLKSIVCVESSRVIKGKKTKQRRYFISSLGSKSERFNRLIRSHWGIESLHWTLDVSFREDAQKIKTGHLPENLSLIRRLSLNFLKQDKTAKVGIEIKRQKAGWDNDYLLKLLGVKFFS
jgi:predicted transposase YbfD/YdcC